MPETAPMLYDIYKPMRNYLRKCNLQQALMSIWLISRQLEDGQEQGATHFSSQRLADGLFLWELPQLAREIVLHASVNGVQSLDTRQNFMRVVTTMRNLNGKLAAKRITSEGNSELMFDELIRTAQQQFPWQQNRSARALIRYLKILSSPVVAERVLADTSLSVAEWTLLGAATAGRVQSSPYVDRDRPFDEFGIDKAKTQAFFDRISIGIPELRSLYSGNTSLDQYWDLQWSPLQQKPLVSVLPDRPNLLFCPMPMFMLQRFNHGIYYDLASKDAIGKAFENYIWQVTQIAFTAEHFQLIEERPYRFHKNTNHGPDAIISDPSGHMFVECKAKRLTLEAKFEPSSTQMHTDLQFIANSVVQNYQNILKAEQGVSAWTPNQLPIYPLVVTLEDWFFFSHMHDILAAKVQAALASKGMDANLPQRRPYYVMSANEYEDASGVIASVGLQAFFAPIGQNTQRSLSWNRYLADHFPERKPIHFFEAFAADLEALLRQNVLPPWWGPPWM